MLYVCVVVAHICWRFWRSFASLVVCVFKIRNAASIADDRYFEMRMKQIAHSNSVSQSVKSSQFEKLLTQLNTAHYLWTNKCIPQFQCDIIVIIFAGLTWERVCMCMQRKSLKGCNPMRFKRKRHTQVFTIVIHRNNCISLIRDLLLIFLLAKNIENKIYPSQWIFSEYSI